MINALFLDDMDYRHSEFSRIVDHMPNVYVTKVYTASAAIDALSGEHFDQVFLDHDLCSRDIMMVPGADSVAATGMDVVDHILTMPKPPPQVVIHSMNLPAATRMAQKLESHPAGIWVRRIAFHHMMDRIHQIMRA